jgi:Ca-activated chloride channel family protein
MTLAHPAWLLLLLIIPLFVIGAILVARLRRKQWAVFAAPRLRSRLLRRGSPVPRWLAFGFLLAAVALMAGGLSRPQTVRGTETEMTKGRNVLLALDLSRSMLVTDLKPDRLTQAKTLCYDLMEALPSDRIGVIGFAGEPYLVAPLTVDHPAVRETISQLDLDYIPVGGSNLEGALELAIKTLKETGQKENALVLLTDGDETTGRMSRLAEEARRSGIYVFTIGMGTELGDFVPDKDFPDGRHLDGAGNPVRSPLQADPLKRLAQETGGRFAAATSAASIPEMVKLAIADMEQFEIEGRERQVPVEYYQWFVLPAILMLIASIIAGTRWRGLGPASASAAAALVLFAPAPAEAGLEDDARLALQENRPQDAAAHFKQLAEETDNPDHAARYRLAQANAAYRAGKLDDARNAFSEALKSEDPRVRAAAHHGLGTQLFGSGWKRLSNGAAYPEVGAPGDEQRRDAFGRIVDSVLGLSGEEPEPPAEGKTPDPMEVFDGMVRQALSEWMQGEVPENGDSAGQVRFNRVLDDWIDGVKHFDAALRYDPGLADAKHNRGMTVKYLKKLREILEEVQENAQQLQPGPGEGEGEGDVPQPEGQQGEGEQEGEGQGEGEEERDGQGDEDDRENQGEGGERPNDRQPEESDKNGKRPQEGETPEDAARRILRENADFEKGALNPGRLYYEQPEKDW